MCTGNSCRSQIAEGIARKILPNYINIYSAGVEAHGINPNAIQTMAKINIDISKQTSKAIDLNDINASSNIGSRLYIDEILCPVKALHVLSSVKTFSMSSIRYIRLFYHLYILADFMIL